MSMQNDEEVVLDDQGNAILNPRIREEKRAAEKERDQLRKENRNLQLQANAARIGIAGEGMGKFFLEHYDGAVDEESIKTAAREAGVTLAGQQQSDQQSFEQRREAQLQKELDELRGVSSATSDRNGESDLTALKELENRLRGARTEAEFDDIMASPDAQRLRDRPINFN